METAFGVVAIAAIVLESGGGFPNGAHFLTVLVMKALTKSEKPSHLHFFRQNMACF